MGATGRLRSLSQHIQSAARSDPAAAVADSCTPVALIIGAGAGIGQGVGAKFAAEGYHTVLVRRGAGPNRLLTDADDSKGSLEAFAQSLRDAGGLATTMFAVRPSQPALQLDVQGWL